MEKNIFFEKLLRIKSFDDSIRLAQEMVLANVCYFFDLKFMEESKKKENEFKEYMAEKFDVEVSDIQIVGSAWFGYSLNPLKNFRSFDDTSDIDIVIISKKLFHFFWDILFDKYINNQNIDNFKKMHSSIFKRQIDTESSRIFLSSKKYDEWYRKTNGYNNVLQFDFNFPSKVGYRIYKSWSDYEKILSLNLKVLSENIKKKEYENEN